MLDYQINCYRNSWVLTEITKAVDRQAYKITNTASVEERIMNYVGRYIADQDPQAKNRRYITRLIYQKIYEAISGGNRKEHAIHFADISYEDDSGELIEYDPVDSLAIVDTEFLTKETVALLAKNDGRREMILNAWANGNTNDTELSETLAGFLGGQSRSHCKYIQRFRIECRSVLTAAI